jgi:tetratricopeptide (TPR) repeat protein
VRVRRQWAEIAPPRDAWEDDDTASAPVAPLDSRFQLLEFAQSATAWNKQGVELASAGQYDAALAAYEKAVAFNPNSAVIHSNLSRAHRRKNRPTDAIAQLTEACRLDPDNVDYSRRLAALHVDQGDMESAEAELLRASGVAPENLDIWYELHNAFQGAGRTGDAVRVLAAARERFPADAFLNNMLCAGLARVAATQAEAGHLEAAERNIAEACALRPSWPIAKAWIWIARGNLALARGRPFRSGLPLAIALAYLGQNTAASALAWVREVLERHRSGG